MLIDALRRQLKDPGTASFQLLGEDLARVDGEDLFIAGQAWREQMAAVDANLRPRLVAELALFQGEAHAFLRKYNRSVHTRVAGYTELGRRCRFAYPWPIVAILGIEQVLIGMQQNRFYGLVGHLAEQFGKKQLARLTDAGEDALRRTNRGIFADSAPTVLLSIHADALRHRGETALAQAMLYGPTLPLFDEETLYIARALFDGLGLVDPAARFSVLGALTTRHFAREQAIFSFHLGAPNAGKESPMVRRFVTPGAVLAPVVGNGRVRLARFSLPPGFDLRDHDARVRVFTRAFVDPLIDNREDYATAAADIIRRWGRAGEVIAD